MDDPVLTPEPDDNSTSSAAIFIYVAAVLALVVGIGILCARLFFSLGVTVTPAVAPTPAAAAAASPPISRVLLGKLALEINPQKIRVLSRGAAVVEFSPPRQNSRQWLAAIRNPYQPLQMAAGSPFLENTRLKLPIADNIGGLMGPDGEFRSLSEKDFPRFPFFSAAPTTIGFAFGGPPSGRTPGITLYFLDTESDAIATIPLPLPVFPEWLRDKGSPPAYLSRKSISLSAGVDSISEIVVAAVFSYGSGQYGEDPVLREVVAGEEFKKALLSKDELAGLRKTELVKAAAYNSDLRPALQKIVRLLWYGKLSRRADALNALVDSLHPTIARAIRANPDLNPK